MEKLLMVLSLIALVSIYYFFFFNVNLLYGAIAFVSGLILNVVYAVRSSVNTLEGYGVEAEKKK